MVWENCDAYRLVPGAYLIEDANIRLVRNARFFEPNVHLHFHLKSHGVVFL